MIHPTALVDPDAQLAEDVEVGPYSIIGAGVTIDSGSVRCV
jgi:UDP-N-acetylglucosamine acyltransferase